MTMTTQGIVGRPEVTPPSGVSGEEQIADELFAQRISYDSGIPIGGVLALTRRISALENRVKSLEAQKNSMRPDAEYRVVS